MISFVTLYSSLHLVTPYVSTDVDLPLYPPSFSGGIAPVDRPRQVATAGHSSFRPALRRTDAIASDGQH